MEWMERKDACISGVYWLVVLAALRVSSVVVVPSSATLWWVWAHRYGPLILFPTWHFYLCLKGQWCHYQHNQGILYYKKSPFVCIGSCIPDRISRKRITSNTFPIQYKLGDRIQTIKSTWCLVALRGDAACSFGMIRLCVTSSGNFNTLVGLATKDVIPTCNVASI